MNRSALTPLCLSMLAVPAIAQEAAPSAPTGLFAERFSPAVVGLFWQPGFGGGSVSRYEVSRDGTVVATVQGSPYTASGLDPTRSYRFEITAIGAGGTRSASASVSVGASAGGVGATDGGGGTDGSATGAGSGGGTATGGSGTTGDPSVPAPANARAERYSGSAAELFFDRGPPGSRVEISRDGSVVATTDGASYFDDTLTAGRGYEFSLVRIDGFGERSPPANVRVEPAGTGGADGAGPAAPSGARLETYSDTAAELFFDRYPVTANVVGVEIVRDGQTLATVDGTSYFDDTRAPGRSYTYELIAIDAGGGRSSPTTIGAGGQGGQDGAAQGGGQTPSTGGPSGPNDGSTIDLANAIPVENATEPASLPALLDLAAGAALDRTVSDVGLLLTDQYPENRIAGQETVEATIDCSGGGSGTVVSTRSGDTLTQDWTIADCQQGDGGTIVDGAYRYESNASTGVTSFDFGAPGSPLTVTSGVGDVREIVGRTETRPLDVGPGALEKTWSIDSYRLDRADGPDLGVTGLSSTYTSEGEQNMNLKTFTSSFTADAGFGSPLAVTTPVLLEGTGEEAFYTVGRFLAESGGGAALEVNADDGARQTFTLTLTTADGSTTSTTENFTESLNFPVSVEGLPTR